MKYAYARRRKERRKFLFLIRGGKNCQNIFAGTSCGEVDYNNMRYIIYIHVYTHVYRCFIRRQYGGVRVLCVRSAKSDSVYVCSIIIVVARTKNAAESNRGAIKRSTARNRPTVFCVILVISHDSYPPAARSALKIDWYVLQTETRYYIFGTLNRIVYYQTRRLGFYKTKTSDSNTRIRFKRLGHWKRKL